MATTVMSEREMSEMRKVSALSLRGSSRPGTLLFALGFGLVWHPPAGGQVPCPSGSACQMAEAVLERALERFRPDPGWNLFIDMGSFRKIGSHLGEEVPEQSIARVVGRPFRTDVEATAVVRPHANATPRWGSDPWVIQVDSVRGDREKVSVIVSERFNQRIKGHEDASLVIMDNNIWEYVLRLREGRWVVVSIRRVFAPS